MKKAKNIILIILAFALVIAVAALGYSYLTEEYEEERPQSTQQRVPAPDFAAVNELGEQVTLFGLRGKPVVLNFWATWCPPCKEELPYFDEAYRKYGDRVAFMMLNVDGGADTVASAKDFVSRGGYTFPQYFDVWYNASEVYGVSAIPVTLFIDAQGYVTASHMGMISKNQLNAEIEKLLEE